MAGRLFTSESVTEGHPDKIADQISDTVLDALLADDPKSRVAVETLLTTGLVVVAGEVTTQTYAPIAQLVRDRIIEIGYDSSVKGFDGNSCGVQVAIGSQSPDIAQGVDHGIEQRAVFGLPTGSAIAKITRRMSPGLLVEAFYNRFGLFASAPRHSVYAQVLVRDAYTIAGDGTVLRPDTAAIRAATGAARAQAPFPGVRPSQRPELHIPGIHLHHSVDLDALAHAGGGDPSFPVRVVDASVLREIGPEHHSFKMMLAAHDSAASLAGSD